MWIRVLVAAIQRDSLSTGNIQLNMCVLTYQGLGTGVPLAQYSIHLIKLYTLLHSFFRLSVRHWPVYRNNSEMEKLI